MHAAPNCPFHHPQKRSMKFQIEGTDALPSDHFPIFPAINSKRLSSSKINELLHPHLNLQKKFHRYFHEIEKISIFDIIKIEREI